MMFTFISVSTMLDEDYYKILLHAYNKEELERLLERQLDLAIETLIDIAKKRILAGNATGTIDEISRETA